MSKITNDGLTRSGTGMLYSCTHMATVDVKGLTDILKSQLLTSTRRTVQRSAQLQSVIKRAATLSADLAPRCELKYRLEGRRSTSGENGSE